MAKVYVGTYGKYNNGSLGGEWIDLAECGTYDNFVAKCREVHKGEKDPEFMIQDTEELPSGLDCGEWLSREEFDDIIKALTLPEIAEDDEEGSAAFEIVDYSEKAVALIGDTKAIKDKLKKLGGRFNPRLKCGAGWIFSKSKEEQLKALISGKARVSSEKSGKRFKEWLKEAVGGETYTYEAKHGAGAVKVGDGYFWLVKPNIQTRFCFSDEGPEYEYYKKLISDEKLLIQHFMERNLQGYNWLKNKNERIYIEKTDSKWKHFLHTDRSELSRWYGDRYVLCEDPETEQLIREGVAWAKEQMVKRLNTYIKRYGTSKIRTWTYWANR